MHPAIGGNQRRRPGEACHERARPGIKLLGKQSRKRVLRSMKEKDVALDRGYIMPRTQITDGHTEWRYEPTQGIVVLLDGPGCEMVSQGVRADGMLDVQPV